MSTTADVVVIGAGASGLAAAYAARRRDASVVIVERRRLGGDCTWAGCVPSKTMIEVSRRVHAGRRVGLTGEPDFAAIMEDVEATVRKVSTDEDRATLEALGITVLEGQATFTGDRTFSVDGTTLRGEHVVLATGSRARLPDVTGLADVEPLTNDSVFDLRTLPRRLAVIGGGPIALELGQAFARLGSTVTLLERGERLAGKEEPEVSTVMLEVLAREGITVALETDVTAARRDGDDVVLSTTTGEVRADAVLVATGREQVTEGLDPERGGVEVTKHGAIKVDEHLATTADGVWAVGDVIGGVQFTHAGYDMGTLAINNAYGRINRSFSTRALPWATFTDPEIGRVGLTEAQAYAEHGEDAQVAYLPIAETDRAKCSHDNDGFVKLVAGPRKVFGNLAGGQLVGATVMCPTGGDVVHELALAIQTRCLTGRLAQAVHAYPTWSLAVREAAAQYFMSYKGREARPARP